MVMELSKDERDGMGRAGRAHMIRTFHLDTVVDRWEALYLAEYRTAFGNAFRANPMAERTPLSNDQIVDLVVKALSSV